MAMEEQIRFTCRDCRYKFSRKNSWNEDICPYCGKPAVEKEDTLNKMINDQL